MLETQNPLEYYACPGKMSDPKAFFGLFHELPTDIPELCQVVQGILLHGFLAERYGVTLSEARKQELHIRPVSEQLARIWELEEHPLTMPRAPEKRVIGTCRDFSLMFCSMLRHQGIPARARCGFATYFLAERYEDHWICEYWNSQEERWVMVDPQIDHLQQEEFDIHMNILDLTSEDFLSGANAWQRCRSGQADPNRFGIRDMRGLWFIRGNLVRDLASLNKMELLPWDLWGIIEEQDENLSEQDQHFLDQIAALILADNPAFPELRSTYEEDVRVRVPSVIRTYLETGVHTITLAE